MSYQEKSLFADFSNSLITANNNVTTATTIYIDRKTDQLTTDLTLNSLITFIFVDAGILDIDSGQALTFQSPSQIVAPATKQITLGTITFKTGGIVSSGWWGTAYTSLWSASTAFNAGGNNGAIIEIPNEIEVPLGNSISCGNKVSWRGIGEGSVLRSASGSRTAPMVKIPDGIGDFSVENVIFDGFDEPTNSTLLEFQGDHQNITIQRCTFRNGDVGISLTPPTGKIAQNLTLSENLFERLVSPLKIGGTPGGSVQNTKLLTNTIDNSSDNRELTSPQHGITLAQGVSDILLETNVIQGNKDHGIFFDWGGERISFVCNTLKENGRCGIFCEFYEEGGSQQLIFSANLIEKNQEHGVQLQTFSSTSYEGPYLIDISDNDIFENQQHGIYCVGKNIRLAGNNVYANAQGFSEESTYHGIYLEGSSEKQTEQVIVCNNNVSNNGHINKINAGLLVDEYCKCITITGNTADNDDYLSNPDTQEIGIEIAANTSDIILKNNQCGTYTSNFHDALVIDNAAGVLGETISCEIGTYEGPATVELPVFAAPTKLCLLSAFLINASDIPQTAGQEELLKIFVYGDPNPAFSKESNSGAQIKAFEANSMPFGNPPIKHADTNDVITFKRETTNNGYNLNKMRLILHYATF